MNNAPFAAVRVVEAVGTTGGGYCGKLFADGGACVIKVEPPAGDPMRSWAASMRLRPGQISAMFHYLNAGKHSVAASDQNGVEALLLERCREANLLITDLTGGIDLAMLERVVAASEHLIVVCLTPFGLDGPYVEDGLAATEFTMQALCGSLASRGLPESHPLQAGGRIGEWIVGVYAAVAAAASLADGGHGQIIDVSSFEAMVCTMGGMAAVGHSVLGMDSHRSGRSIELPSIVACRDGLVGLCTVTRQQFQSFLVMIGREDLLEDGDLATAAGRMRRRLEFQQIVDNWASGYTTAEIVELAAALRIPVGPVATPDSVTQTDHFVQRGVFCDNPAGFHQPRVPYGSADIPSAPPRRAPALGEHEGFTWPPRPDESRLNRVAADGATLPPDARPLTGLRVVDLTAFWAGPIATLVLAALGAEVIKVEGMSRPDGMRFSAGRPPSVESWWEWGTIYLANNYNKMDVSLELDDPRGRDALLRLIGEADVMIENFSPRVLDNLDLAWGEIHRVNPSLILVRMPAFGVDGPWRDRVGFAQTIEQVSGLAWLTGDADGPPLVPRGPCDPVAGLHAAFAALVALRTRDQTGRGLQVEATMVEAALNIAAEATIEHSAYGTIAKRHGNAGPEGSLLQGVYRCLGEDSWVAISVLTKQHLSAVVRLVGARERTGAACDHALSTWTATREVETVVGALQSLGIAAARVIGPAEMLGDRQLRHRSFWEPVKHSVAGDFVVAGMPFRVRGERGGWVRSPPPLFGEHNTEIFGELLGMDSGEIAALVNAGVIGDRPRGV